MKKVGCVAFAILLAACHHDEVKNRTVFSFTIDPLYDLATDRDNWIIVRDDHDGELIGAQEVAVGGTVVFESKKRFKTDNMAITILQVQNTYGQARVYTGIPVGSEWTLGDTEDSAGSVGQPLGTYSLNVLNVPSVYQFAMSDFFGYVHAIFNSSGSTISANAVTLRQGAPTQLITLSTSSGSPKYKVLKDVNTSSAVNVDFNTFEEFDKVVNVKFSSAAANVRISGYVTPIVSREQFVVFDNNKNGGPLPIVSELNLGFLNDLPNYKIDLTIADFQYHSIGPAPTSIQVTPSVDFAVTSSLSMLDYTVTSSKDYSYKSAEFYSDTQASYFAVRYYSKKDGSGHHDPLTPELMEKYSLSLDAFKFTGTRFILDDQYEDLVDRNFNPDHDRQKPYIVSTVFTTN
jgi:hypothetical protein